MWWWAAAALAWDTAVVWDDPDDDRVRSVALALDPSTGERFFVVDLGENTAPNRPTLQYLRWDGAAYSAPVALSNALTAPGDSYMVSAATAPGSSWLVVLGRADRGAILGTRTHLVERATGVVLGTSDGLTTGFSTSDHGRSAIVTDGSAAHACFTYWAPAGDDLVANHTVGVAWQRPQRGDDWVLAGAGVQDHCGLALRSDGTRVLVHHDTPDDVVLTLEDAPGVVSAGFPLRLASAGGGVAYNHPVAAVRPVPGGDELHVVYSGRDSSGFTVWHTTCVVDSATTCATLADWSPPLAVTTGVPTRPRARVAVDAAGTAYVAWLLEDPAADDVVSVASRCSGAGAFVDTGLVDAAPGDQAFGVRTDGTVDNRYLPTESLAVDDVAGTLHLAWVRATGGDAVAVEGWTSLATCP
jgi:hypothetical protein